jgi:flavin-dependent thymidylate synthase
MASRTDGSRRPNVPEADELLGIKQPVLSHGYVVLVDYMGNDAAIVQAARVSYGKGTKSVRDDKGLIRYLLRHRHTTPFEMVELKFLVRLPIYVARQWIRHRTACLAEGTELWFDGPRSAGPNRRAPRRVRIEELWGAFAPRHDLSDPGAGTTPSRAMERRFGSLRQMNEATFRIQHTRVADVFRNGTRPVYRMVLEDGRRIECTADHRFRFLDGWKTLATATGLRLVDGKVTWEVAPYKLYVDTEPELGGTGPSGPAASPASEPGPNPPPGEKSDVPYGPGTAVAISSPAEPFATRSLDTIHLDPGSGPSAGVRVRPVWPDWLEPTELESEPEGSAHIFDLVDASVPSTDDGPGPGSHAVEEADPEPAPAPLIAPRSILARWTQAEEVELGPVRPVAIVGFEFLGMKMTYDVEVTGPYSNFIANGIVTHNSVNEYSARYSVVPDEYDLPPIEEIRRQSTRNRQGRGDPLPEGVTTRFRSDLERINQEAYKVYSQALTDGIARETARLVLPLSYYTEWYWKIDLWNLLHFLSLRLDPHAQEEIRLYAAHLAQAAQRVAPVAYEAFEDFTLGALWLSRKEQRAVRGLLQGQSPEAACAEAGLPLAREDGTPMSTGEGVEFLQKLERLRGNA